MADIEVGVRCDRTGCWLTVNSRDRTGTPHVDRTLQDLNPEGRLRSVPTDPTCGPNEVSKQSVANLPPSEQAVAKRVPARWIKLTTDAIDVLKWFLPAGY
ncbi:hypothetical protein PC128_g23999 [Phytophthora cactorum]|nr:hypothetical protein PC128_g23999 [Phytophthora cactorum]